MYELNVFRHNQPNAIIKKNKNTAKDHFQIYGFIAKMLTKKKIHSCVRRRCYKNKWPLLLLAVFSLSAYHTLIPRMTFIFWVPFQFHNFARVCAITITLLLHTIQYNTTAAHQPIYTQRRQFGCLNLYAPGFSSLVFALLLLILLFIIDIICFISLCTPPFCVCCAGWPFHH